MDNMSYRDICIAVLAATAEKCERHAMLAITFTDVDDRAFHKEHAERHSQIAFTNAAEWWARGLARGELEVNE